MITDFLIILQWWLLLFLLGILSLPLAFFFFNKFWDKGYVFSKILAILLSSYLIWLLGSLKLAPFGQKSAWGIVVFLAIINFAILKYQILNSKKQKYILKIKNLIKEHGKIWLFEEILFFICLLFWSYVRGFQPDINGLEKFMDYGFVNSILRSAYFPPQDLWLAGKTINYYYFGHLAAAVLTKLSGLDSAFTYNLMIATIFAFCFSATFSLVSNLAIHQTPRFRHAVVAGLVSALIICFASNFHTPYYVLKNGSKTYWYPDATRYIGYNPPTEDKTIHEFPAYSFIVADLHGHLSDLPFVLLFLALLFAFILKKSKSKTFFIFHFSFFISLALMLATMYMTSSWEYPIYLLLLGLVLLWKNLQEYGWQFKAIKQAFLVSSFCFLVSVFLSLPFHLNFNQIAKGIAFVNSHTPFYQLFVLWGFFWLISFSFLIFLFKKRILQYIKPENLIEKIAHLLNAKIRILKQRPVKVMISLIDGFVLIFIGVATLLIILPEIIYVKDIYITSYHRANTMFKLTYQAYILYAISTGYIFSRILSNAKQKKFLVFSFSFLIFSSILIYPYFSIRAYYGLKNYQGLYGLQWLKKSYPDDYQAIIWFKEKIKNQPVILEAVGESYTDYARISANTGLPTVLGWPVHEWLWRGSYDEAGKRREEVRKIYESLKIEETKELLKKYQVQYLFVGDLERKQYQNLKEEKFKQIGEIVFKSNQTVVYKTE